MNTPQMLEDCTQIVTSSLLPQTPSKLPNPDSPRQAAAVFFRNYLKKVLGKRNVSGDLLYSVALELVKTVLRQDTEKQFARKLKELVSTLLLADQMVEQL